VLIPGQIISLQIEKPAAGGRMIARADGQVVLVAGVIPGERATVQINRVGKGVAYGEAISIEEASLDRRPPFVDPFCGGCLYAHVAYARQLEIKSQVIADALGRIGRIGWSAPIVVASSPDEGYRMRSRLHVRGGHIGFFREGSHDLCDARATRQLLPATCDVLEQMAPRLHSLGQISGELEVSENVAATDRVVHLESATIVSAQEWAGVTRALGLTGVTVSRQQGGDDHAATVAGDPRVTDVLSIEGHDVTLRRHVLAFFQANRFLLRDLVAHVLTQMNPGDEVVDLYAGVGVFSIAAAIVRGAHVTAVEGDRVGAADLTVNAAHLGGAVEAVHQSVETFTARRHPAPAVLIVDPPRTGMSKESLQGAIRLEARTVVYVSCDVATLARDARRLLDAGYDIQRIDAFDLFPNTPHVETVIAFRKI
jgi:23S rRNA (uracil1939-C5)-methyltransferase